jgi:hypothetical protein
VKTPHGVLHSGAHSAHISDMKLYTVEEANRTLPLVRRIVDDIVRTHAKWRETMRDFDVLSAGVRADQPNEQATALQNEAQRLAADIALCIRELEPLGVEFKDYDLGLVDFPSLRGDRAVYLCWRLGEPDIRYWHELDGRYAGRQPIEPLAFA